MSVQQVPQSYAIETTCPIVINSIESIFSYQTASTVAVNKNVNSRSASCYPNDYAYLQVYTAETATKCCSNNALQKNINTNTNSSNMMGY